MSHSVKVNIGFFIRVPVFAALLYGSICGVKYTDNFFIASVLLALILSLISLFANFVMFKYYGANAGRFDKALEVATEEELTTRPVKFLYVAIIQITFIVVLTALGRWFLVSVVALDFVVLYFAQSFCNDTIDLFERYMEEEK